MKNPKFKVVTSFLMVFLAFHGYSFAQSKDETALLNKQILSARDNSALWVQFSAAKDFYFKDNRYEDFVKFLKVLEQKKKTLSPFTNYFVALSRYQQLKFLEEKQIWDEYFSQGNSYRDDITTSLEETFTATSAKDPVYIYSRLLLWQFHKEQQDSFLETALADLMNAVTEYTGSARDFSPLKAVADKLLSYGEQAKSRELYKIYIDKIAASEIKEEELRNMAGQFLKEGNLDLAETVYNVYIKRIKSLPKEEALPLLIAVAKEFTYKDEGIKDPLYAENVFQKIEELTGKDGFDGELLYLRAYNMEKAKEFIQAKEVYLDLITLYPQNKYLEQVEYKIGLISLYVLRDMQTAKEYFSKLLANSEGKPPLSAYLVKGGYLLGLLAQWETNDTQAKEYYDKILSLLPDDPLSDWRQTRQLIEARLKEIKESKPLDYNLKTFLDLSLKEEFANFNMSKADLKASLYKPQKGQQINLSATAYPAQSGCTAVVLDYLWSGDLGEAKPTSQDSSFNTAYTETGTKVICLVVTTPSGIIDRVMDLIDVE